MIIPLTIARVPISNAFTWYRNAWTLLKAQPLILFLATSWVLLSLMMLASFPFIGAVASSFLTPVLAFGMADICQKVRTNQPANPLHVFAGIFGANRKNLFTLGVFYATVALGCLLLTQLIDGGELMRMAMGVTNTSGIDASSIDPTLLAQELANDPVAFIKKYPIILALLTFQISNILISSLFTYAPMFIGWQNANPNQAVALSLISIGRNFLSIGLAGLITLLTLFGFTCIATILVHLLPAVGVFTAMLLALLNFTFIYAITYTSYYGILSTSLNNSVKASVAAAIEKDQHNDNLDNL